MFTFFSIWFLASAFWHTVSVLKSISYFVSISSVTFWHLYRAARVLTLGIQTRHSRRIRLQVHLNILETCYQRSILLNAFHLKNNLLSHVNVNVALQFQDLFFAANALWLIRFSLNEIPSSGFDSSFTLLSIASSPYQVISGTNVHNSSKYTTMIHAQLFQRPFNNSKSIPCI